MRRKKTENFDWLVKHLEIISEFGSLVNDGNPTTDYGNYTALKSIAVHYTAEVFSRVATHQNQKERGFDGAVYVDLFAGTGLVKVIDTNDYIGGSPVCAILNKFGFDYSVCVDINEKTCNYLENRLSMIAEQESFKVINGDSNKCINEVIASIKQKFKRPIVLVFVDPQGMEIKFSTLKALSDAFFSCDFLINVNAKGVSRVAGKIQKGIDNVKQSLEEYLEEDATTFLKEISEGKTPQGKYASQVINLLGKKMGDTIAISDTKDNIAYYLLGYTRLTSGGSGYIEPFIKLKSRLEWADRNDVRKALDQIYKRGPDRLDKFF